MHPQFIDKYTRYLRLCQIVCRVLPPSLALPLCGRLSRLDFLPRPGTDEWRVALAEFPLLSEDTYEKHLGFLGVMEGASFYFYKKFQNILPSVKFAPELAHLPDLSSGVLVLTYHHHFNVLLCAFLGCLLNRRVNVLAMDPDLSPLAKPLAWYKKILYDEAEMLFSGGRFVLVRPDAGNSLGQGLRDMVRNNSALVSVHDFGHPFANDRTIHTHFLGRKVVAPVGAIAFATSRKLPVVAAWVDWDGGARFTIKGHILDAESEESTVKSYFSSLEMLVAENPALWEGWPGFSSLEIANSVPNP